MPQTLPYSNTSHVLIYRFAVSGVLFLSDSNTSHVLIYHQLRDLMRVLKKIQIHLMFLFIWGFQVATIRVITFKYISCSYLSFYTILTFPLISYSNTSHVLIYRNPFCIHHFLLPFKYISCSYLSNAGDYSGYVFNQFKYISCSYLSSGSLEHPAVRRPFKYISCSYLSLSNFVNGKITRIQIHLMFLFIYNLT